MADKKIEDIKDSSQIEYNRVLDGYGARGKKLSQSECQSILEKHGADEGQARNGAYVYLFKKGNAHSGLTGNKQEYNRLLNGFDAPNKTNEQCIQYLESLGYSYRQAASAAYNYRKEHGLTHK